MSNCKLKCDFDQFQSADVYKFTISGIKSKNFLNLYSKIEGKYAELFGSKPTPIIQLEQNSFYFIILNCNNSTLDNIKELQSFVSNITI